jgi:hypothetical protein
MTKVAGSLEEAWLEQCAVRTRHAKSGSAESQANLPVTTETKRGLWTVFHKDSQVSISIFRSYQLLNTVDETYENEGAFCLVSCFFSASLGEEVWSAMISWSVLRIQEVGEWSLLPCRGSIMSMLKWQEYFGG